MQNIWNIDRKCQSPHLKRKNFVNSFLKKINKKNFCQGGRGRLRKMRHPRRYGLATAAHFLHALGPWSLQPGERESVQRRRASSAVTIRRQPAEPELRLPVSKRQLAASVSMTSLEPGKSSGAMGASTRGGVVLFWTPEYWYRPRAATAAYRELRRHLSLLRDFRSEKERVSGKKFFCRRKTSGRRGDCNKSSGVADCDERSSCILGKIFSSMETRKKSKDRGEDPGEDISLTVRQRGESLAVPYL